MSLDEKWMQRALALAVKGQGQVHPNPMVGAVLVNKGRVVGEGFHERFARAHAEINALEQAGQRARGSTLYLTLEPCSHWGKTPPCVDSVISAGVKRVVAAMKDPNPRVGGKGFAKLRARGIRVEVGILEKEARHLNRAYLTWTLKKRPYVTLKLASSLDGRTATLTGESKWITSLASRQQGHRLRAQVDAIAVGAGTVIQDNPSLTAHSQGRDPIRIVFAGRRVLPKRAKIFHDPAHTWVVRGVRTSAQLHTTLKTFAQNGIAHLLVEGGETLHASFLHAALVDEVIWFVAPVIIGSHKRLRDAVRLPGMSDLCIRSEVAA